MGATRRTPGRQTGGDDTIILQPPYQNFHSLRLMSRDAAVHVKYFLVTFDNGVVEMIDVDQKVEKDGKSLPIKLTNVGQKS